MRTSVLLPGATDGRVEAFPAEARRRISARNVVGAKDHPLDHLSVLAHVDELRAAADAAPDVMDGDVRHQATSASSVTGR